MGLETASGGGVAYATEKEFAILFKNTFAELQDFRSRNDIDPREYYSEPYNSIIDRMQALGWKAMFLYISSLPDELWNDLAEKDSASIMATIVAEGDVDGGWTQRALEALCYDLDKSRFLDLTLAFALNYFSTKKLLMDYMGWTDEGLADRCFNGGDNDGGDNDGD